MSDKRQIVTRKSEARQARARYLAQSMQLEEAGVPGVVSLGVVATAMLVVGAIAWASVTPVEELVRTAGQVIPHGHNHLVQHIDGGRVADIMVEEGDRVHRGDVVLRLASERAESELEQARVQEARLALEVERLRALDGDRTPRFGPVANSLRSLVDHQRELFDAERTSFASRLAVADGRVIQRRQELERHRHRAVALERQLQLLEERHRMLSTLNGKGGVARNDVLALGAQVAEVRADYEEVRGSIAVGEAAYAQSEQEREETRQSERARIRGELADSSAKLAEVRQTVLRLTQQREQLEIRSPVDGIVKGLTVNTVNQVVRPGEVLLEVVPVGHRMVVESRMSPHDVGFVREGIEAHVAVDSFDVSRFGTVSATVDRISASTYLDESGNPFYKVQLELDRDHVGDTPESGQLLPGMTVQANIVTGEKTVLDYLLKPVYRGFREALHER